MKTRIFLILTALLFLTGSIFSSASSAATRSAVQLTDNAYNDASHQINSKGDVVWHGFDGNDYEIYLNEGATGITRQLTNNEAFDHTPQINANGDVVWFSYNVKDLSYEIYFYEKATETIFQLAKSDYDLWSPKINCRGDVVWLGYDGKDYEVFLHERATGITRQLTDNETYDTSPQINDNGDIAWQGDDGSDYEIFLSPGVIEVEIDIRPRDALNAINLRSRWAVPVAVLTNKDFDATTIMPQSVIFAGASPFWWKTKDVDRDGDLDMVFLFKINELIELSEESTEATLTGETSDGTAFKGTDSVNIVPKRIHQKCHKHYKDCKKHCHKHCH